MNNKITLSLVFLRTVELNILLFTYFKEYFVQDISINPAKYVEKVKEYYVVSDKITGCG